MEIFRFESYIQKDSLVSPFLEKMEEWLRRLNVNPFVSARVGSNPTMAVFLISSTVKWIAICSLNILVRVQISEKTGNLKSSATTFFENLERNKITGKRIASNAMFWIASYFTAYFLENSW